MILVLTALALEGGVHIGKNTRSSASPRIPFLLPFLKGHQLLQGARWPSYPVFILALLQDESTGEITFYMKGADVAMSTIVQYNDWLEEEVSALF